jgi:Acetyltransferase (GNAT) domain
MWAPNTDALTLLDSEGGPFSMRGFRDALIRAVPGWRDVSFGASGEDGVMAAVALLARGRRAESVPPEGYGGVVASRELTTEETESFLALACQTLRLPRLTIRSLELEGCTFAGKRLTTASVVPVSDGVPPADRYARLARRSLKRASEAGATVVSTDSFETFWPLYATASEHWTMRYPESLVRQLVDREIARVHSVRVGRRAVASLLTLVSSSHWMCWLAAQTDEGRACSASYLAYDTVLSEALAAGITAVNLGASVGGGAEFKGHLGAKEVWMREWRHETTAATVARVARGAVTLLTRPARGSLR